MGAATDEEVSYQEARNQGPTIVLMQDRDNIGRYELSIRHQHTIHLMIGALVHTIECSVKHARESVSMSPGHHPPR